VRPTYANVNVDVSKVSNFWCHAGQKSEVGDILCLENGYFPRLSHKQRGDILAGNAVLAGSTRTEGENYVCRNGGGAGKLNLDNGQINNFWIHGNFFAKGDGYVLLIEVMAGHDTPAASPEDHHTWHHVGTLRVRRTDTGIGTRMPIVPASARRTVPGG